MPYYYSPFRRGYSAPNDPNTPKPCPFCVEDNIDRQTLKDAGGRPIENEHYRWMVNWFPRCEAHTMIVPKRHLCDIFAETPDEVLARQELTLCCIRILQRAFPESGFENFLQTGKGSLSSVEHLHWHLVPTIPQHDLLGFEKIGYFDTREPDEEKVVITPIEITIARDELLELVAKATLELQQ